MTEVKDVTGTAFVVAEFRARENAEPHPLYLDPIVPIFLDDRTKRAADRIAAGFAAAENNVRLRTRYLDDRLDEQLANGCRQVVILGSGLDTRAVRKRAEGVAYFEIDDPSTVNFKRARLAERGIDAPIHFIAGNYVASGVVPLLEANGFDCDLPSFFIWEGNTMYLTEAGGPQSAQRSQKPRAPIQHLVRLHGPSGGRADDRRAWSDGFRRALRGDGCALALRYRRPRSARRGDRPERRRRQHGWRSAPEILAGAAVRVDHLRPLHALHSEARRRLSRSDIGIVVARVDATIAVPIAILAAARGTNGHNDEPREVSRRGP